ATMVVLSLLTAIALHQLVEVRFRYVDPTARKRKVVGRTLAVSALCCALGIGVLSSNGMVWRYQYFTPGMIGGQENLLVATAHGNTKPGEKATPDASKAGPVFVPMDAAVIDAGK
ncbi:hypothetical protein, partial [Escherichia coli]|uniref:hypothetical protein n=1 Tax=Escherichia coli TaxID=562 RepID=UPI0022F05885